MQVAAHVDAFGPGLRDGGEVAVEVVDAFGSSVVAMPFSVTNSGRPVRGGPVEHLPQAVGVDGPAHLRTWTSPGVPANQVGEAGSTHCLR